MIVPQLEQWMAGEEPDEDTFNKRIRDVLEFLLEPPQAMAVSTAAQTIPNATWTVLTLDATIKDNDGIVDLAGNLFRITTPGWYEVVYGATLVSCAATGRRISALRLNGTSYPNGYRGRRDTIPTRTVASPWSSGGGLHCLFLNAGDTLENMVTQDTGAAVDTTIAPLSSPFLQVRWVSM